MRGYSKWLMAGLLGVMLSPQAIAQTFAPEGTELVSEPDAKSDPTRQKYLALYIGIESQEKLPSIPEGSTFKGDFKKVTDVSVARELSTLLFTPKRVGVATLTIYDRSGTKIYEFRVDVKKSDLTKVAREMRELLKDIEGISIKIINNRVVVDGQILLPRDMNRIYTVVRQYDGQAASIVVMNVLAQKKIAKMIEDEIRSTEITVRAINDKFVLEGVAADKDEKDRAEIIAKTYIPDIVVEEGVKDGIIQKIKRDLVINLITVKQGQPPEPGKIIQLVVHYVELNKNYQKGFRFEWMPTIDDGSSVTFGAGGTSTGTGLVSSITGTVKSLLPKLNWAKQHGHARVLQSTSLLVTDGQKGDLKSVTRLPYQVINAQGQPSTNFEEAGLITAITPQIINPRSDNIKLSMEFSMKALLSLTDAGPIVSNSSIQTQIVVKNGQSAAVGGLIGNTTNTDYNKLPKSNSDSNPLISLYASKSFQRNQSQFVVFVTPIIKSSASAGSEKIKKKFRLRD